MLTQFLTILSPIRSVFCMRELFVLFFLFISVAALSQETKFKTYTHTELFQMIAVEKDTIFKLKDAIVQFEITTDSIYGSNYNKTTNQIDFIRTDTIVINKALEFDNVHFEHTVLLRTLTGVFNHIKFIKPVTFINTSTIALYNCVFLDDFSIRNLEDVTEGLGWLNKEWSIFSGIIYFDKTVFKKNPHIIFSLENHDVFTGLSIAHCDFFQSDENKGSRIFANHINYVDFKNNSFYGEDRISINAYNIEELNISYNDFNEYNPSIILKNFEDSYRVSIIDNVIGNRTSFSVDALSPNFLIPWQQLDSKIMSPEAYEFYLNKLKIETGSKELARHKLSNVDSLKNDYFINKRYIKFKNSYKKEVQLLAKFRDFYEKQHDPEDANKVYLALKNLETDRLKFLYKKDPSFKTYFKWKVNQFLKIFSDYGTEPSKAIVFSIYVILAFAFIYLFFPNTWDSHGKNRILDRYKFFIKYMNQKAGIHEVYLDEKKEKLLEYDEFKTMVESKGKTVPKFFTITALPIYKWAVSGTKLSVSLLKRIDFLEGNWEELPENKRFLKKALLIGVFCIVLLYDIFVKMLNALMLSVNTFTTLGFGEIPIKGIPRYLAIIQGFIGWFMLTIFSVSLITQLLK